MLRAPVFHCLTRSCVEECQRTGSLKETSIKHCMVPADGQPADKSWYAHEPLYLQWKEWNCKTECRYHCMMERENERKELNLLLPVKYHGKWPLKRASVFQVISQSLCTASCYFSFAFLYRFHAFIPGTIICCSICPHSYCAV
jgi:hypothetical protein